MHEMTSASAGLGGVRDSRPGVQAHTLTGTGGTAE